MEYFYDLENNVLQTLHLNLTINKCEIKFVTLRKEEFGQKVIEEIKRQLER